MQMAQLQAHQGYILTDGRLIFDDTCIRPPKNIKVIVFWEEAPEEKTIVKEGLTSQQLAAKSFLEGVERITANGLSDETLEAFEKLERGDFKFKMKERLS